MRACLHDLGRACRGQKHHACWWIVSILPYFLPPRHSGGPAAGGIQEDGPGCQVDCESDACGDNPCMVIPAWREWILINHWIPACAGMTAEVSFPSLRHSDPVVIPTKARLHGCTPTGMQGVRRAQPSRGRAASGTSRRGGSNSPPLEGCPPGRGGKAASGTSRRGIQEGGPKS